MTERKKTLACGGILINFKGEILLRQPKDCFDDYVWTYPKGRPAPGESHEQAALREVLEETGYEATILTRLPGEYEGGFTRNIYFLMKPTQSLCEPDTETARLCWVSPADVLAFAQQNENRIGVRRDLEVLEAALKAYSGSVRHF